MHIEFQSLPSSNKIRGNRFSLGIECEMSQQEQKNKLFGKEKADGGKEKDLAGPQKLKEAKPIVRKPEKQYDLPNKTSPNPGGI